MVKKKKIILIDFDGVLHSYSSGWQGADVINDPPVEGAIEWLTKLVESQKYFINIYSSRSRQDVGIKAIRWWLLKCGISPKTLEQIKFPTQKPAAFLTIDDRAICFKGKFPTEKEIDNFMPWNKKVIEKITYDTIKIEMSLIKNELVEDDPYDEDSEDEVYEKEKVQVVERIKIETTSTELDLIPQYTEEEILRQVKAAIVKANRKLLQANKKLLKPS